MLAHPKLKQCIRTFSHGKNVFNFAAAASADAGDYSAHERRGDDATAYGAHPNAHDEDHSDR